MNLIKTKGLLIDLVKPETHYLIVAMIYGIAIALLTLAIPIAVQTLVNTISNIASARAVTTLSLLLFGILLISGLISALRMRLMEYYERRVYARLTTQLSLRTILAPHNFFEGRKNSGITHRYFDIMIFQKNIPSLIVDGFAIVLQMLVGFTLVSFYHPALFTFNLILLGILYLIWKVWGGKAKETAIGLSNAKYKTAKWLNSIASAHEFFKSNRHLKYAAQQTDKHISEYIQNHRSHFKYTFTQAVMFLLLYAAASAALLGLGGWLVIQGELSIGQLIAAELIMSAVFFGLSRFSVYLKLYYELFGAADKIGHALSIPQEELNPFSSDCTTIVADLECSGLLLEHFDSRCELNVNIPSGAKLYVFTEFNWRQRKLVNFLKCYEKPNKGWIKIGGIDISDYDIYELRQMIATVDRSLIVECSIKDFLRMSAPNAPLSALRKHIELVGLENSIYGLPDGLDTQMSPLGAPLQPIEVLLLKLAAALLTQPKIVILNQHFDSIPQANREGLLAMLEQQDCIVLYFSNHHLAEYFDGVFNLDSKSGKSTQMLQRFDTESER